MVTRTTQPKPQLRKQRKHIDAIADAARLHQQRRALAAERGAGDEADAFLLGGQHHVGDGVIGLTQLDQPAMAGIRHIADLANADAAEMAVDRVRPGWLYVVGVCNAGLTCLGERSCAKARLGKYRTADYGAPSPRAKSLRIEAICALAF